MLLLNQHKQTFFLTEIWSCAVVFWVQCHWNGSVKFMNVCHVLWILLKHVTLMFPCNEYPHLIETPLADISVDFHQNSHNSLENLLLVQLQRLYKISAIHVSIVQYMMRYEGNCIQWFVYLLVSILALYQFIKSNQINFCLYSPKWKFTYYFICLYKVYRCDTLCPQTLETGLEKFKKP